MKPESKLDAAMHAWLIVMTTTNKELAEHIAIKPNGRLLAIDVLTERASSPDQQS